jgi:hypothetical protein
MRVIGEKCGLGLISDGVVRENELFECARRPALAELGIKAPGANACVEIARERKRSAQIRGIGSYFSTK